MSVAEGDDRIGAVSVSISSASKVITAKVIPSKNDPVFVNTIAEKVASMINGICLFSMSCSKPLELEDMKAIMGEVMNTVSSNDGNDQKASR